MIKANKFKRFIKKEFREDLRNKTVTFYSWWCTDELIGILELKKRHPKLKVFSRIHAYDLYFERHQPNYLPFRKFIFSLADKMFVISEQGYEYLIKKMKKHLDNLTISRLGSINHFQPTQTHLNNTFQIVSCSALIPLKRIELIIEALSEINDTIQISWVHFGEGPEENSLKQIAEKKLKKLNHIKYSFYGAINNHELHKFYQKKQIDLFINVSSTEGVPISIMEAMSYGIPCVGTDVGGVSELIKHNINGYLLDVNFTSIELTKLISTIQSLDSETKDSIRKSSYQFWNENYNADINNSEFVKSLLS